MNKTRIAIIGGGIIGCSIAYHLTQKGEKDISVFEKLPEVGKWESWWSAAMIMHQTGNEILSNLAKKSIKEYTKISDKVNIGIHKCGSILYTTTQNASNEESVREIERRVSLQRQLNIETTILTQGQIQKYVPFSNVDDIIAGSYCPDDGYVNPTKVTFFFADEAQKAGAKIYLGTEAIPLIKDGRIYGIKAKNEDNEEIIEAEYVINAAGGMAHLVGNKIGLQIPIITNIRYTALVKPRHNVSKFPILEDIGSEWYFRPDQPGTILFGEGPTEKYVVTESNQWNDPPPDNISNPISVRVAKYLKLRVPMMYIDAPVEPLHIGIRSKTPNGLPFLGGVDSIKGYVNCCGMSGFGVTIAPACGEIISEFILDGKTSIPLDPFLLSQSNIIKTL